MARAQLTNNAVTTLSAAISSTAATSFTVNAGGGNAFPSTGYFYVTVLDVANVPEIMKCTSRASDVFTVTRAQDGTTARTFAYGARVSLNITAAVLAELLDNGFGSVTGVLPVANGGTGQSTLAAAQAALGFASGTRMPFAQAAAPTGWTQDTSDNANNRMLRVVMTAGGAVSGTDSPILNNVVPSHTHTVTTGTESATHTHVDAGHSHAPPAGLAAAWLGNSLGGGDGTIDGSGTVTPTDRNPTAGNTQNSTANLGVNSASHTHSGTTAANTGAANWSPRYIDMIICAKN